MQRPVIVVGVDGSPGSAHALAWAVRAAERAGGSVRALMSWSYPPLVVLPHPIGATVPPAEGMDEATAQALASVVEPVAAAGGVEVAQVVGRGAPARALLAEAADADLLVVGTRGRGTVASVLLGSVSRAVAAAAPCPVAVVPEDAELDADGPVLVGVDGSRGSLAALRWAGSVTEGPIHAVHVFEYPFGPEYAVPGFEWDDPEEFGHKLLELAVADTLGDRPDVTTTTARGDARRALVDAGRGASMIVVGARGATGVEGAFLGSVTTAVATGASVPVVVVPDP